MADLEQDEVTAAPEVDDTLSLLDDLGALREKRARETTTDISIPGTGGRLWGTYRLPASERVTQVSGLLMSGQKGGLSAAMNLLADANVALFLAHGEDEDHKPVRRVEFPGCTPDLPMGLDPRLESVVTAGGPLCPPRPGGKAHTPATRIRAVIASDALVCGHALALCGWALGGEQETGALEAMSAQFVGE